MNSLFWDQRMKKYGHTGWGDQIIYGYDQPLRLKVIKRILYRTQGTIKNKKILDIGCGVGDFSIMFAAMGADVTGIDISEDAIKKAKENSKGFSCNFLATSIKDMNFSKQSFDIISSITVLQHIPYDELLLSIQKIADSLKIGGYIYILETSPNTLDRKMNNSEYQNFHTRAEWITIFENIGLKLYYEKAYPSIGIYLINNLIHKNIKVLSSLYHKIISTSNIEPEMHPMTKEPISSTSNKLYFFNKLLNFYIKLIFCLSKPFDYYMPFLSKGSTTRIMIFKK